MTTTFYFLFSSVTVACIAVKCYAVCVSPFPQYTLCRMSTESHSFVYFYATKFLFLGDIAWKLPLLWMGWRLHLLPAVWNSCKILNMSCLEFKIGFLYYIVCQNFHLSYQLHSCCLWSVGTTGCVNIYLLHHVITERDVKLLHFCPVVCQLVS